VLTKNVTEGLVSLTTEWLVYIHIRGFIILIIGNERK
jgi:hypothetical protein